MPTPRRAARRPVRVRVAGDLAGIRPPGQGLDSDAVARAPPKPGQEEAWDKRSKPQDVTSSVVGHGGANLQQEVEPHLTEKPPRDSSIRGYQRRPGWSTTTRQPDRRPPTGLIGCLSVGGGR